MKKDFLEYKCLECGTTMEKRVGKFGDFYVCPRWRPKDSPCKGHIFYPTDLWKVASETTEGLMYSVKGKMGKLYCECPAGMKKKECKHRRRIRESYNISDEGIGTMKKMFNSMKEKGHFKEHETYEEWEKDGRLNFKI